MTYRGINAAAESVMGLYKTEAVAKGSPFRVGPLKNADDVEDITMTWVAWYNEKRLHSYLGHLPPEEFEANYYAEQQCPINRWCRQQRGGIEVGTVQFGSGGVVSKRLPLPLLKGFSKGGGSGGAATLGGRVRKY